VVGGLVGWWHAPQTRRWCRMLAGVFSSRFFCLLLSWLSITRNIFDSAHLDSVSLSIALRQPPFLTWPSTTARAVAITGGRHLVYA
jgi:hypothetical protein